MRKLWLGYHISRCQEKNLENMIKYARAIQSVQKDLGIKITSFPHLGIYGDVLILNNKQGERIAFENHSELKEKQEKFEKWQAENAKKIQEKLQKPDKEKGESIVTFVDDVSPYQITEGEETVPDLLEPDEEEGEEEIVRADDIPFQNNQNGNQAENTKKIQEKLQKPDKEKGESIVTFVDDVSAH